MFLWGWWYIYIYICKYKIISENNRHTKKHSNNFRPTSAPNQKDKKPKNQTYVSCLASPVLNTSPWVRICFCFLVLLALQKKWAKIKYSDRCLLSSLSSPGSLSMGLMFLVLVGLPKSAPKPKHKKKQKVQTYVSCPASAGPPSMGLNFLFFPTCQVRVVRLLVLRSASSAGPQPQPSTPSVPCRTSTTAHNHNHNHKHTTTNTITNAATSTTTDPQSQTHNHKHTTTKHTTTNTQPQTHNHKPNHKRNHKHTITNTQSQTQSQTQPQHTTNYTTVDPKQLVFFKIGTLCN